MRKAFAFAGICCFMAAFQAGAEQYYKWKDEKGVLHYTTTPPPTGTASDTVSVISGTSGTSATYAPASASTTSTSASTSATGANSADQSQQADQKRIQAMRDDSCKKAKERETTLAGNPVVAMDKDGDGKNDLLSAEEQAKELARARQAVTAFCGGR